jgi:protein-S-isoprenylcysteine O-methyltransferase Ste14
MDRRVAYMTIGIAVFLGWASLLAFLAFLVIGPLKIVDLGLGRWGGLWLDTGLSLLFFIQHSVMIRTSFRTRASRLIPEDYFGALYTVASGIALLAMVVFWQESDVTIASAHGVARWLFRAVPLACIAGFVWGVRSLRFFDPFGTSPITNRLRGKQPRPMPLVAAGPYRWVRHPLYLFIVLMIWSYPDLTADRLVFNILWTFWIVVASLLEERDLLAEFGDSYRRYQRRVPMLIPYRIPTGDTGTQHGPTPQTKQ